MPGIAGVFGGFVESVEESQLLGSLDLAGTVKPVALELDRARLAVAKLENAPLRGASNYQDERFAVLVHGDLAGINNTPYPEIIGAIEEGTYEYISALRGTFAIAVHDKLERQLYLISDRTSQEPFYYYLRQGAAAFSTSLATFVRLPESFPFDAGWLYEQLFFNIPVGQTTPLVGVRRMPPGSVLRIDVRTWSEQVTCYCDQFEASERPVGGPEGLERAYEVFSTRVPAYFRGQDDVACALTGGYDSRTVLALAPKERYGALRTFTYGAARSADLLLARGLAKKLGLEHLSIEFDETFVRSIPAMMDATIRLSGGLQGVGRSTLPFVYKRLTDKRPGVGAIVSAVAGDHFFRGRGNSPAIISPALEKLFTGAGREEVIDTEANRALLGRHFDDFAHHVSGALGDLEARFGPFQFPACHLLYSIYEVSPKYFGGEAAIAGHFASFRCPYWDSDIIDLACRSAYSTLTLSRFSSAQDPVKENLLQAHILVRKAFLPREPIGGRLPSDLFATSRSLASKCRSLLYRLTVRERRRSPPIEDWSRGYSEIMEQEVARRLLGPSPLEGYLSQDAVAEVFARRELHLIRKLASVEILLRLLDDGWEAVPAHARQYRCGGAGTLPPAMH